MSSCCSAAKFQLMLLADDEKKEYKTMIYVWHDVLGGIGVVFILLAYFLLQLERVSPIKPPYLIANGLGSFLILVSLVNEFNLSAFAIEAAWFVISVYGLMRCLSRRRS